MFKNEKIKEKDLACQLVFQALNKLQKLDQNKVSLFL